MTATWRQLRVDNKNNNWNTFRHQMNHKFYRRHIVWGLTRSQLRSYLSTYRVPPPLVCILAPFQAALPRNAFIFCRSWLRCHIDVNKTVDRVLQQSAASPVPPTVHLDSRLHNNRINSDNRSAIVSLATRRRARRAAAAGAAARAAVDW